MEVLVAVKFKYLCEEQFVAIAKNEKDMMKKLRDMFPYLRGTIKNNNLASDKDNTWLLRVFKYTI